MQTARLFINGRSQAVRLPKAYQFKGKDVYIQKIGDAVILFQIGIKRLPYWKTKTMKSK
jgi:antitoxin VapB